MKVKIVPVGGPYFEVWVRRFLLWEPVYDGIFPWRGRYEKALGVAQWLQFR